ncbi:hypothetical protein [Desulforamulus reducens]|uniref:hypothetical protein n=1 Tax=Desulforamulus reducens TaxID=59610 RepID=UPI0018DB3AC1
MEKVNRSAHQCLKYSGGSDSVEWMIPKVLWFKNHRPEIYQNCYLIIEKQDWLNYQFTGKWVSSRCTVTCKWNYVDIEGGWSIDFMKEIGLGDFQKNCPLMLFLLANW